MTNLNTKYNIIQGAMAQITLGKFAATVSNEGALGVIATGGLDKARLKEEIEIAKSLTDKPFAINLMRNNDHTEDFIQVILEEKVSAVVYNGDIRAYLPTLKENNVLCVAVVNTVAQAVEAEKDGADIIIAEGEEAGGHIGPTSSFVLIPQVVDAVSIPVYGAGGIADKRGVDAAYALGAQGVQIGTLLIASEECNLPTSYKQAILDADDVATTVTGRKFGSPVRIMKNNLSKQYLELEYSNAEFEDLEAITRGSLRKSVVEGDVENGSVMIGQAAGLIHSIRPIKEIIKSLI